MKQMSFSITKGKGSINHNSRKFKTKNVDPTRTKYNVTYSLKGFGSYTLEQMYDYLFNESVEEYNSTQKRKDRKIDSYYHKVVNDNKTKTFHELVVQIGNQDNKLSNDEAKKIYSEFIVEFRKNNPQMELFKAYLHLDEKTPHLHLDYIPVAKYNKGLKKRVSNDKAIKQMGFTNFHDWREKQFETLEKIALKHDIERVIMDNQDKHVSVEEYKIRKKETQKIIDQRLNYAKNTEIEPDFEITPETISIPFRGEYVKKSDFNALKKELDNKNQHINRISKLYNLQNAQICDVTNENELLNKKLNKYKNKSYIKENERLEEINQEYHQKTVNVQRKYKELENELVKKDNKINTLQKKLDSTNRKLAFLDYIIDKLHLSNFVEKIKRELLYGSRSSIYDISQNECDTELINTAYEVQQEIKRQQEQQYERDYDDYEIEL